MGIEMNPYKKKKSLKKNKRKKVREKGKRRKKEKLTEYESVHVNKSAEVRGPGVCPPEAPLRASVRTRL